MASIWTNNSTIFVTKLKPKISFHCILWAMWILMTLVTIRAVLPMILEWILIGLCLLSPVCPIWNIFLTFKISFVFFATNTLLLHWDFWPKCGANITKIWNFVSFIFWQFIFVESTLNPKCIWEQCLPLYFSFLSFQQLLLMVLRIQSWFEF